MSIVESFSGLVALGSAWVLWLLVGLSIIGVSIALERGVHLWFTRVDVARLSQELREALSAGNIAQARRRLDESPSFEARIANAGLLAPSADSAEEFMAHESELCRLSMERHLLYLGTLGNNAPFVGLLGTVIGVIRAFRALHASSGQLSGELIREIGEALIATAVGLLVALPAVVAFNFFQRLIRTRLARAHALSKLVLGYLKSGTASAVAPAE